MITTLKLMNRPIIPRNYFLSCLFCGDLAGHRPPLLHTSAQICLGICSSGFPNTFDYPL